MHDPELQSIALDELPSGAPLGKTLLALNNAHAAQLSWLEPERLEHLVRHALSGAQNWQPRRLPAGARSGCAVRQPEFSMVLRALSALCLCRSDRGRGICARTWLCAPALSGSVRTCDASRARPGFLRGQHKPAESGIGRLSCRLGICRSRHRQRVWRRPDGAVSVACAGGTCCDLNILASYAGLTRVSINLRNKHLQMRMDCRVIGKRKRRRPSDG